MYFLVWVLRMHRTYPARFREGYISHPGFGQMFCLQIMSFGDILVPGFLGHKKKTEGIEAEFSLEMLQIETVPSGNLPIWCKTTSETCLKQSFLRSSSGKEDRTQSERHRPKHTCSEWKPHYVARRRENLSGKTDTLCKEDSK